MLKQVLEKAGTASMRAKMTTTAVMVPVASSLVPIVSHAADEGVVDASSWASVISALTSQISVSTVVAALATFVGAAIGLVFMWWGLRKGVRTLMGAFRKGRLSV